MHIYDVSQVAEMLRLSVKTVRHYIATRKLVGRKVGKRWLVTEDALHAFMDADRTAKAS
jgi:excisionase family DNA binding protein